MQFSLGDVMFERTTLKASSFGTRFDIIIWYVESRYETWMYVESIEMSATDALSLPLPQWRGRCVSACLCLCVCVCSKPNAVIRFTPIFVRWCSTSALASPQYQFQSFTLFSRQLNLLLRRLFGVNSNFWQFLRLSIFITSSQKSNLRNTK